MGTRIPRRGRGIISQMYKWWNKGSEQDQGESGEPRVTSESIQAWPLLHCLSHIFQFTNHLQTQSVLSWSEQLLFPFDREVVKLRLAHGDRRDGAVRDAAGTEPQNSDSAPCSLPGRCAHACTYITGRDAGARFPSGSWLEQDSASGLQIPLTYILGDTFTLSVSLRILFWQIKEMDWST